ncbi:Fe2+-dependent dioxygenase [Ketobacter sp.]|nr:MAG: Fe2+-dependent dioxygenase [Ketobacter sp.]
MLLVVEGALSKIEVKQFRLQLAEADWEEGASSAGELAKEVKLNQQFPDHHETGVRLGNLIVSKLSQNPQFISAALPKKIYPPKFNRYAAGGRYGVHVDSAVLQAPGTGEYVRSDISATLFLSEPDEYQGGELVIEGSFGAQPVKLCAGDLVLYPASSLHQVQPVEEGERVSSFFWVQSMVRDDGARELLYELDQSIQMLRTENSQQTEIVRLSGIYHNLLRRWIDV